MTPTSTVAVPEVSPDDPRVVAALEAYLAAAEVGNAPDRAAFLNEHADIAGPLADCLDGLDFLRAAAPADVAAGPAPAVDAPDRLGDFRLVREIGRGGMGVVYEAEQLSLGRRVAVKVLAVGPGVGPAALRRFKHEARAAGLLAHPNVVPVYSVGCDRGVHFYAMRLVDGPSLADLIARPVPGARSTRPHARPGDPTPGAVTGPAPAPPSGAPSLPPDAPRFAAGLALQAAEALAHAHAAGVVHRDVKPGNLLLDGDGRLWVTDFGLAYLPDASRLTRTGSLVGTLRYMSPEQVDPARGGVDHRADLYGLGATLYELLTRRPPVDGDDQWTVVGRILNRDPVPPRRLNPAVPADLETVVLTLLAKDPADRYRSAAALAADLRRFLAGEPVHARRPGLTERAARWAARHRRLVAAAAAVGLAVVALQGVHQVRLARERDETRAERQQARAAVDDFYTHVAERWLAHEPGMEPRQREFLAKARDHYDRLARSAAGTREDRLSAAVALRRVADIDARLGSLDPAADAYAEALARLRPLVAEHPGWADPVREAAIAATDYGTLLRARGRLDDAGREYRAAADGFRALVDAGSADTFDRAGLAGVENNQGLLWQQLGKPSEAERCFRAARAGFARLAAEFPDRVAFTSEAAGCCHNLAELFAEAGRDADAEPVYRDALTLRRPPVEQAPAVPAYRRELARTQAALAALLLRTGRVAEADRLAAEAAAGRKRLADDFPATPAYRLDLACSLRTAAECAAAADRPAEALDSCDRAADLLRALAASDPTPAAVGELARTRRTAGVLLAAKADGAAEATLREAVDLADRAGDATPLDRQTRTACRLELARWYAAHGSPAAAARVLCPVAAEGPPDGPRDRALWAQVREELARLSAAQGGD